MKATPDPPVSVAARVTEVGVFCQPPGQAAPLQLIVLVGGVVSIWISWVLAASALPALS